MNTLISMAMYSLMMAHTPGLPSCGGEITLPPNESQVIDLNLEPKQECTYSFKGYKGQILTLSFQPNLHVFFAQNKEPISSNEQITLPQGGSYSFTIQSSEKQSTQVQAQLQFLEGMNFKTVSTKESTLSNTYEATLPCIICDGIKTTLQLHQNGTYQLNANYMGLPSPLNIHQEGQWITYENSIGIRLLPNQIDAEPLFLVTMPKAGNLYFIVQIPENSEHKDSTLLYRLQPINQ